MTRFEKLLEGYVDGQLSEKELQEFLRLLDNHWSVLSQQIHYDLWSGSFDHMTDAGFRQILYEKIIRQQESSGIRRRFLLRLLIPLSAAAVILFAIAGAWLWPDLTGKLSTPSQISATQTDIHPGANKAILTLSNGTVLTLDSAKNGILAKQNNTAILKLCNGALACKPAANPGNVFSLNTITTPRGGSYQIVLSDGSKVYLNAASSLRFPSAFPKDSREVEITGEAYLEIARRPNMPFRVKVNGIEVQVLGTSFNINAYSDESAMKITLLDGAISIAIKNENIHLRQGQQALISEGRSGIRSDVDTAGVIAWKNGSFDFTGLELPEIMRQISRWYDIEVVYQGKMTGHRFSGIVSRQDEISEVLKFMTVAGIKCRIEGKKITIL